MFIFGVLIFYLGIFIAGWLKGISMFAILYVPAVIFPLLASILAVLAATRGFRTLWRGLMAAAFTDIPEDDMSRAAQLKRLLFPPKSISEDELGRAATLFRLLTKTVALMTALIVVVGIVSIILHFDMIEWIGHGTAGIFSALLHALMLIAGVFEPAVFILKKRQSAARGRKN